MLCTAHDRQARISAGVGAGAQFRQGRRDVRRHPADLLRRHQAARGDARRHAGPAHLSLPGLTAEGERVLDWARGIVADARAMRLEMQTLKKGLTGHLRIAAIPTALAMVSALTTPYRAKHPNVKFTILSRTSTEALSMLENLEVDAG